MNPQDAQIVRVYTQVTGSGIPETSPNVVQPANTIAANFDVVVEAESGATIAGSTQQYTLSLLAYDVTAGTRVSAMDAALPGSPTFTLADWPSFRHVFPISTSGLPPGHLYKYTASLVSRATNVIASFMESPLFILE